MSHAELKQQTLLSFLLISSSSVSVSLFSSLFFQSLLIRFFFVIPPPHFFLSHHASFPLASDLFASSCFTLLFRLSFFSFSLLFSIFCLHRTLFLDFPCCGSIFYLSSSQFLMLLQYILLISFCLLHF